jgi:hypothetical protein
LPFFQVALNHLFLMASGFQYIPSNSSLLHTKNPFHVKVEGNASQKAKQYDGRLKLIWKDFFSYSSFWRITQRSCIDA